MIVFLFWFLLFCAGLEGIIFSVILKPDTWWVSLLRYGCLTLVALLFVHFLEWLMPGSTLLKMKGSKWSAKYIRPDGRTVMVIFIMGVIVFGASIGVLYLPFPMEVRLFMFAVLALSYVFWFAWYPWMKRGKVPAYYDKQTRKSNIRPRRNTPARRRR
jgi:hypothetical protein